jgi:hypothetical protein
MVGKCGANVFTELLHKDSRSTRRDSQRFLFYGTASKTFPKLIFKSKNLKGKNSLYLKPYKEYKFIEENLNFNGEKINF